MEVVGQEEGRNGKRGGRGYLLVNLVREHNAANFAVQSGPFLPDRPCPLPRRTPSSAVKRAAALDQDYTWQKIPRETIFELSRGPTANARADPGAGIAQSIVIPQTLRDAFV